MIGITAAIGLWLLVPKTRESVTDKKKITIADKTGTTTGLVALIATGTLDSGVRMGCHAVEHGATPNCVINFSAGELCSDAAPDMRNGAIASLNEWWKRDTTLQARNAI